MACAADEWRIANGNKKIPRPLRLCGEKAWRSRRGGRLWVGLVLGLTACGNVSPTPAATRPGPTATPWPTPTPARVSTARFAPAPCAFVLPEGYVQGKNVTCDYLAVPENQTALPSRALRLAVGIFHPAGGTTAPDPLIYLSGGPGGSVLGYETVNLGDVAYGTRLALTVMRQHPAGLRNSKLLKIIRWLRPGQSSGCSA